MSEAVEITEQCCRKADKRFDLRDVAMLSIGAGQAAYSLVPPAGDAGMLYWSQHIANVMGASQVQGAHLPLTIILGDRYVQVDFPLDDPAWTLDNVGMTDEWFSLGIKHGEKLYSNLSSRFFTDTTTPYDPCATCEGV